MKGIVYPEQEERIEDQPETGMALVGVNLNLVKPGFAKFELEITKWEGETKALEVRDDESRGQAAMIGGAAAKLTKKLDAKRKEILAPYKDFEKSLNGFVAGFTDRLRDISNLTKAKEMRFVALQEMQRREAEKKAQEATAKLQAKIDKEAEKKGIEPIQVLAPVVPPQPTKMRTETGTTSYEVKSWAGEIINDSEVPRVYCEVSQRLINQAVKEGCREIPGVKIYEKTEIRYRT
jgi:hypothetical protein